MLRLALAYLIALAPALVLLAGLILFTEMTYHLSVKATEGTTITLFHIVVDAASAKPWIAAVILIAGGFWLFRMTWPVVGAAWHDAFAQARGAGRAK